MKIKTLLAAFGICAAFESSADKVFDSPTIYVNRDVTTHIIMPENIKLVDISTERIVGDQCADNMLRIKPVTDTLIVQSPLTEGDFMGSVTLIGERHMAQYNLIYTNDPMRSNAMYKVKYETTDNYSNPDIPMTEAQMANYACWHLYTSPSPRDRQKSRMPS